MRTACLEGVSSDDFCDARAGRLNWKSSSLPDEAAAWLPHSSGSNLRLDPGIGLVFRSALKLDGLRRSLRVLSSGFKGLGRVFLLTSRVDDTLSSLVSSLTALGSPCLPKYFGLSLLLCVLPRRLANGFSSSDDDVSADEISADGFSAVSFSAVGFSSAAGFCSAVGFSSVVGSSVVGSSAVGSSADGFPSVVDFFSEDAGASCSSLIRFCIS